NELWILDDLSDVLVTPLRWDPDGFGAIIVVGERHGSGFGEREIRVSRGIADITSLALGNASRLSELERFHELVASLDAIFWEATTDLAFTFVGGRSEAILGSE